MNYNGYFSEAWKQHGAIVLKFPVFEDLSLYIASLAKVFKLLRYIAV